MREVSNNADVRQVSPLFSCFLGVLFGLAISQPVRAQGTAESQSLCVSSDLSALVLPEGKTVRVSELKEGRDRKGAESSSASSSDVSHNPSDIQRRKEAYEVFSKEAKQGNPAAMTNLAVSSLAGWGGGTPNAGAALYWLHAAADRGFGAAFYDLGILYFEGCGVRQDMGEAFRFFELGAKGGYAAAQINLGYFYDHGLGVAQDHAAAAHWYLSAAESGEAQAQYNLADLYLHGEGVPRDEPAAFEWYKKAALKGHTGARIMVGSMLAAGRGTSKDLAGAYLWVFVAVLQGDDRGVPLLRDLERQLPGAEIEEAKARGQLLLGGLEAARNR
ncbi:MAG TPA: tetratricopeptide repeat protein [Candidatus Acidoferrum sp.]|nr:tetratricopeptide repeat protein [Candidatus Acidoferrum sp.]